MPRKKVTPTKPMVRYPWDEWLKQKEVCLVKGKHFKCQPHSMLVMIRNAASARGRSVRLSVAAGSITIHQKPNGRKR